MSAQVVQRLVLLVSYNSNTYHEKQGCTSTHSEKKQLALPSSVRRLEYYIAYNYPQSFPRPTPFVWPG